MSRVSAFRPFAPPTRAGLSSRSASHRPVAHTLSVRPAPPHLGVGLSRGSEKLPHRLERLDGTIRL